MISKTLAAVTASAAIGGLALLGGATAAQAAQNAYGWVAPGGQLCVTQYANYKVRGEGTASSPGVIFRLRKTGGSTVATSAPYVVVGTWNAEGRPEFGNFYGAGQYQMCANNNLGVSVYVSQLKILTDGEFA